MSLRRFAFSALLICTSVLRADSIDSVAVPPEAPPVATQHWSKPYKEFHELVAKIVAQVGRNYFHEFTVVRGIATIASIQVDGFSAKVLHEADEVLRPYREGLEACIQRNQSEYRLGVIRSYENFAWFLDEYVRVLVKAVAGQEDPQIQNGVKERTVVTDRALYAYSRLLVGYLEEKLERFKQVDDSTADRALIASVSDIARRVLRLDLMQRFDRRELVEKGSKTQPVFRDLARSEGDQTIATGIEPINRLLAEKDLEGLCKISLPPRKAPARAQ